MSDTLFIARKFRGPPKSGNGGYVSGVVAAALTGGIHDLSGHRAVEVTLRAPTPLDRLLTIGRETESITLKDDETLIAEARIAELRLDVPLPTSWNDALAARERSYSFETGPHPFFDNEIRRGAHPVCFCCSAELSAADGLHVYAAPVKDGMEVAAAWNTDQRFADDRGMIRPEYIWTALDCPGQMAWRAQGIRTGMLGRLTARIDKSIRAGERCIVIGWTLSNEGKKFFAGTALFNQANELCAYARAVWIGRVG